MIARLGDVRRYMDFGGLVFTASCAPGSPHARAWAVVDQYISSMRPRTSHRFGLERATTGTHAVVARASLERRQVALAIEHLCRTVFHLDTGEIVAVVAGLGVKYIHTERDSEGSLLVWWKPGSMEVGTWTGEGAGHVHLPDVIGPDFGEVCSLHIVFGQLQGRSYGDMVEDELQVVDLRGSSAGDAHSARHTEDDGRLSTIQEGSQEDGGSYLDEAWWTSLDTDQRTVMQELLAADAVSWEEAVAAEPQVAPLQPPPAPAELREAPVPDYHYLAADALPMSTAEALEVDDAGNQYVEMLAPGDFHKLILGHPVPEGMCARLRVYVAGPKKAVIDRDTDLLTPEEFQKHAREVSAAVLEELKVWHDHACFRRRPRRGARNVLDCRWVGKWKRVKHKTDPSQTVRVIRMRLTLRGFKDVDADTITTYAGTSSRLSQRVIVSEAAIRGWAIEALDVKKAFLKGVSYAELAEATGED